jgi:mRNA interferase RelE/StbE
VSWTVEVQRSAEKELAALPPQARERIAEALRAMRDDPFPHGVKKLKARDGYRIRVGDYRILFRVDRAARLVRVGATDTEKRFIDDYRSAAACSSRPSNSSTIRLMCL